MRISLILAHPHPGSFNHALAAAAAGELRGRGHEVLFHDLCAEGFDPLLPAGEIPAGALPGSAVAEHCREIAAADGIVVVHPNWWGMPPAILKGWVDRVLRPGVAYRFDEDGGGRPVGLLKARIAVVINTSDTTPRRERETFGDPLETIWRNCIFGFCGVHRFHRRTFGVVCVSTADQRATWLTEARQLVGEVFGVRGEA
ncbi:MAG TPA: NAD(P)H-dependent oxidoreductase [Deferrisomatales bacterium]|nr:NAD(P)H-dependent oxidoreductase [Deferrisomatales bacterium]